MIVRQYETEQELAKRTGTARDTWAKRRRRGDGPSYVKIGKSVRYLIRDVDEWLAQRQRSRTHVEAAASDQRSA
jgi:predicted DNA-binding transcriptional regulator AlpA